MAYAVVIEFDADLATHEKIMAEVGDAPVDGMVFHGAGECDGGIRVVDIWESKEHADRFTAGRLSEAMGRAGVAGGPPSFFQDTELPLSQRG